MNERLRISIPGGELEKGVLETMQSLGLEFQDPGRTYFIRVNNMPLDLVIIRASEVPNSISDERSLIGAGITGSDIIWESGIGKDSGLDIPYKEDKKPNSFLYIGIDKKFSEIIDKRGYDGLSLKNLIGCSIATKYPRIAEEYLSDKSIWGVKIRQTSGKVESIPRVYLDCVGVLDVVQSGKTRDANGIIELDRFYDITVRMIEAADKLTPNEKSVLEDLKEMLWLKARELNYKSR